MQNGGPQQPEHHQNSDEVVCCGEEGAGLKGKALGCIGLFTFQPLFLVLEYGSELKTT